MKYFAHLTVISHGLPQKCRNRPWQALHVSEQPHESQLIFQNADCENAETPYCLHESLFISILLKTARVFTMSFLRQVPSVTFKTRVRDESLGGDNPFKWQDLTTEELFKGKRVIVFALPGAFTPTCSSTHLPRYEELYSEFEAAGINDIICLSVNDAFVMYQWGKAQGIKNVRMLPDGNAEFTRKMGMLVNKDNLGFGARSWRYAMVVNDGQIEEMFIEPEFGDNAGNDPFEISDADTVLNWINQAQRKSA